MSPREVSNNRFFIFDTSHRNYKYKANRIKKVNTKLLRKIEYKGDYAICIGNEDKLIKTPEGNPLISKEKTIELVIKDLQRFEFIHFSDFHKGLSINSKEILLYDLLKNQIDFDKGCLTEFKSFFESREFNDLYNYFINELIEFEEENCVSLMQREVDLLDRPTIDSFFEDGTLDKKGDPSSPYAALDSFSYHDQYLSEYYLLIMLNNEITTNAEFINFARNELIEISNILENNSFRLEKLISRSMSCKKGEEIYNHLLAKYENKNLGKDPEWLRYFERDEVHQEEFIERLKSDFKKSSIEEKNIFMTLLQYSGSLILTWCFCYQELDSNVFIALITKYFIYRKEAYEEYKKKIFQEFSITNNILGYRGGFFWEQKKYVLDIVMSLIKKLKIFNRLLASYRKSYIENMILTHEESSRAIFSLKENRKYFNKRHIKRDSLEGESANLIFNEIQYKYLNKEDLYTKLVVSLENIFRYKKTFKQTLVPLKSKILRGESKFVEFKQSLSLDIRKIDEEPSYYPIKEKYLEKVCIKTIAGFLNAEGGELFIGIKDNPIEITGIEKELEMLYESSTDKIQTHIKDLIDASIGLQFIDLIDVEIIKIENKKIIRVLCKKSNQPIMVKDKSFFLRSGPSTDELQGKKLLEYIKKRFPD